MNYEDLNYLLLKYLPDIFLPPLWTQIYYFSKIVIHEFNPLTPFGIEKLGVPSNMIWFIESDHLASKKRSKTFGLTKILNVFDEPTKHLIVTSTLLLPLLCWFVQKKFVFNQRREYLSKKAHNLFYYIRFFVTVLMENNAVNLRKTLSFAQHILLAWMMAVFTMRIFFADNMFSILAHPGGEKV